MDALLQRALDLANRAHHQVGLDLAVVDQHGALEVAAVLEVPVEAPLRDAETSRDLGDGESLLRALLQHLPRRADPVRAGEASAGVALLDGHRSPYRGATAFAGSAS